MKKIIYLVYYIKETPKDKFFKFLNYASNKSKKTKIALIFDIVFASWKYNISILDYFYFRFFKKNNEERKKWAGTGYMYEFQLKMNPKNSRKLLEDKIIFLNIYNKFVIHNHVSLDQIKINSPEFLKVMQNPSGKIVFKDALGQCGFGIQVDEAKKWNREDLIAYMESKGFNLLESFVQQANELQVMSPSGLNTIRIFTLLTSKNEVVLLGSRLRITINSKVDNMASGNMAAVIDDSNGVVISEGFFSDITKENCLVHPVTGVKIVGFQVPFWKETLELVKEAALLQTTNRSVGWDVAITNNGPELIEGNHNWCKLLWQLPVQSGLKHLIEPYNV
jgi:hypothetical protein